MNIEQQKEKLLVHKAELDKELSSLGTKISSGGDWMVRREEGDGNNSDPLDDADRTENFEEKIAVLKVLEERYTQLNRALQAIKDGTYGICSECGERISEERLAINPSATTCIEHG